MPAYRFSWDAFDDDTVAALAAHLGHPGTDGPRAWLGAQVKRPDEEFVRKTKDVLEWVWLPKYPGSRAIVEHLLESRIGPMGGSPATSDGAAEYVARCRNSATVRRLLVAALLRFGDKDRNDEGAFEVDFVPRFAILTPSAQPAPSRKPHPYQREAWSRLSDALARAEGQALEGLVVMPTGSGKTFTTTRWLVENVINRGGRVPSPSASAPRPTWRS